MIDRMAIEAVKRFCRAFKRVGDVPAVRAMRSFRYDRQFRTWPGAFRGVYSTFDEAMRSAPPGKIGYDYPELAAAYRNRLEPVTSEYPVMFWLQRAFDHGARTVFDYGGHVGLAYYAFGGRVQYPTELSWRVCDLPNMVEQGRARAFQQGATGLTFTTERADADGFDVLYAQGSLQYMDVPLAQFLQALASPPTHLLINQVPLSEGPSFVTLQNTIYAYNPYNIFNRGDFLAGLHGLGYELVDAWRTPELAVRVPFHPEHTLESYSGIYLRRRSSQSLIAAA